MTRVFSGTRLIVGLGVVAMMSMSSQALAETVTFESRTLSQIQRMRGGANEYPTYQVVSLSGSEMPNNFSFDIDMQGNLDDRSVDDRMSLYQAAFHVEPSSALELDGGRQWLTGGFDSLIMDGGKVTIAPDEWKLGMEAYAGVPRSPDEGDYENVTEGLVSGLSLFLQNVENTQGQLSARYQKIDVTKKNYNQNETILVGLAMSHQFDSVWATPSLYSNIEFDTADKTINAGTLGIDLYPHWRWAMNLEGNYFDVNHHLNETTLQGAYLTDELMQGRESIEFKLGKGWRLMQDFNMQRYSAPGYGRENSYVAGGGLGHYWEASKLSTTANYYYGKSFGGRIHGGILEVMSKWMSKTDLNFSFDVSRYTKITNAKDTAISAVGGVRHHFTPLNSLMVGGEYNHNNWFSREGRLTLEWTMGLETKNETQRRLHSLQTTGWNDAI